MIIGHEKQKEILRKIISSGNIPHALLFSGPEGLGKKTMAMDLISSLLQAKNLSSHPDFISITASGKQIKIAQIRDLNWRLSLSPVKASLLGAVIDQAHLMTREAQNCFLKTLEEPKAKSILILVTEYPDSLMPTIISRCESVKFYPVGSGEISRYLEKKGMPEDKIEEILEISLGRPGQAINFLEHPEVLEERRNMIKELIKIQRSPLSVRFQYVKELTERPDLSGVLEIWLSYFRNRLVKGESPDIKRLCEVLEELQRTIFLLSTTNANRKLALEIMVMSL